MTNAAAENNKIPFIHSSSQDNDLINFDETLGTLIDGKWLIILVTLIFFFFGLAKAFLESPVYKSDALLQVNEQSQTLAGLDPLTDLLGNKIPVMAEIGVIKSRMILGEAVANLDLDIIAKPKYFPVIGEAIARRFSQRNQENAVSKPLFDLSHYAWGGEAIQIETLAMPANWENKELILVAGTQGYFQLFKNDELILEAEVDKLASKQLEGNQAPISIFVSLLKSRPNTQFTIIRQSSSSAISQLKGSLTVREQDANSGLLELTLESSSPGSAVEVLNEIANIYVQQNVEHKSAESQKTLAFLEKQLPILKEQLEAANNILNEYKNRMGSIDLSVETRNMLDGIVGIKTQETLLRQNRDELRQRYTEVHPAVAAVDKQIARLQEQMRSHDAMVKTLPKTQQVILELSADVEVKASLYTTLLNNAQTLRVAKEGTVGDVRIIDYAVLPEQPIKPNRIQIIGIAFVLGLFFGVVLVFIRKSLRRGIETPGLIEKQLNIPVYATVPHSDNQEKIANRYRKKSSKTELNQQAILALEAKEDMAVESLRSLRTTLHFALLEATNNIILIAGPTPGIGKTFISTNLATIMADAGKKILLIDGDMRKGYVNKILGVSRENGLSEIILNAVTVKDAIQTIPQANFDFISTGTIPPNPSELLLHENFANFLDSVSKRYDLVIIDSPPILAVTDAAIISRMTSAVFMVAKAGAHPMGELEQSARNLEHAGGNVKGIVFNDMPVSSSRIGYGYGYGYGKYVYQYNYANKPNKLSA
jgi:tyrosine-protein kinase Etk/Wzc